MLGLVGGEFFLIGLAIFAVAVLLKIIWGTGPIILEATTAKRNCYRTN